MRLRLARSTLTMFVALAVGGCLSVSPLPRSYLLSATAPASSAPHASVAVGVGPVRIPAYLDQSSILVRTGEGEVELSGEHRWAEPLRDGIGRTLAENLSAMIPTDAVAVFPWRTPWTVDYRVTVDILRFDGAPGRSVVLDARWRLLDGSRQRAASPGCRSPGVYRGLDVCRACCRGEPALGQPQSGHRGRDPKPAPEGSGPLEMKKANGVAGGPAAVPAETARQHGAFERRGGGCG